MISEPESLAAFPSARQVEVFTFIEPLGHEEATVVHGIAHVIAGQEFPAADVDRSIIIKVPNGSSKQGPNFNMFVKRRPDVFLRHEIVGFLPPEQQAYPEDMLDNPKALLRLMQAAAMQRRPIAPAA